MTLKEKEQKAIDALKTFEPEDEPYYLCYPQYYHNYIKAFDRLVNVLSEKGTNPRWKNGFEVMRWWVSDINEIEGQTLFEGFDFLDV